MNVALPTLVTFIILLPGFILRSRFKRIERSTLDYSPFGQIAIEGVVTKFKLDREGLFCSQFFRFHGAPWYYLLTGADFSKEEVPDLIVLTAIVDVAGEAITLNVEYIKLNTTIKPSETSRDIDLTG